VTGAIRLLIVDDSASDAALIAESLGAAGLSAQFERVDTPERMATALDGGGWDAIIADYKMPGFGGLAALQMMHARDIDLPFIVVSGAVGEETAVETMRAGAHDYVLKQSLTRLAAAVTRELREAQNRRERRQAVAALHDLARRSALLAEASRTLAISLDHQQTLERAAATPIPALADWCLLTVRDGPAAVSVLAHRHPEQQAWGRQRLAELVLDPQAGSGAVRVMDSGVTEWTTPETVLVSADRAAAAAVVERLGYGAGVCLPLMARGRAVAAMTLVRRSPAYVPGAELTFAEELGERVAMALDSAILYREACQAVQARDEFLSVASHELNTPLATLSLQVDDLVRQAGRGEREAIDRGMALARRQVDRLSRLVWDLLDVSRITSGQIEIRPAELDLVQTAREVLTLFAAELARAGCAVELGASGPVRGRWDPARIEQVIANLLSNACRYGAGKPVRVTVEGDGTTARLTVQDQGIGILGVDRERIFERFERASSGRHHGGLGLGLYIARQVVEAHGGHIDVSSAPGTGSTFTVELPLRRPRRHG
jgi:signal transduction histidine kinase/DNA-binding response OmpR family regulator